MNQSTTAFGQTSHVHGLSTAGIWRGGAIGAAIGAAVNVVLYLIAQAAGVDMVAEFAKGSPPVSMPFLPVIVASFLPFVFAALIATLLNRFLAKASRIFLGIAVGFALFSMGGPATIGSASAGLRIVLGLMHVVAAVAIVGGILRGGRTSSRRLRRGSAGAAAQA